MNCIWKIPAISLTFATDKGERRERIRSLLLFSPMNDTAQIQELEQRVTTLIKEEPELFLVEIKIKPTNNIKVFIDGDQGVNIEKLVQYNRRLYRQLEEEKMYPDGNFSLELSSPGLDQPLKLHRQYLKNKGRYVEVTDNEGNKTEGKLAEVSETGIQLEVTTGKGKKMETVLHPFLFENIKTTKIQIKF